MATMLLHCGSNRVSLDDVRNAPTPEPNGTHYPIPHTRVLDMVREGLTQEGLTPVDQGEHGMTPDGMRYFGMLRLAGYQNDAIELIAAVRNTHDKSFAAGLALGGRVFICDNLSFSGEVTFTRKHTRFAYDDLPRLVNDAMGRLGALRRTQEERIDAYMGKRFSNDKAYATIVRASLAKVIPNAKIKEVIQQWHDPAHDEFNPRTGWSLFNGFTEVLKQYPTSQIPSRTQVLHGIFDTACGLKLAKRHVVVSDDLGVN